MADSYARLVADSLRSIAQQSPLQYSSLSELAAGLSFDITIDTEPLTLIADPVLRVSELRTPARVRARTTAAAIAEILDGHTTLEQLVFDDRLIVHATLADVARSHDVLLAFAHGSLRSPAVPELRPRFDALAGIGQ